MKEPMTLGDLQFAIMRVLWSRGAVSVADVHEALLDERGLAPTTIATMLVKLEKKGAVTHRVDGRKFLYEATVSEGEVRRSMVDELTQRLFDGQAAALVSHLLEERKISAGEVEELRRMLAARGNEEDER